MVLWSIRSLKLLPFWPQDLPTFVENLLCLRNVKNSADIPTICCKALLHTWTLSLWNALVWNAGMKIVRNIDFDIFCNDIILNTYTMHVSLCKSHQLCTKWKTVLHGVLNACFISCDAVTMKKYKFITNGHLRSLVLLSITGAEMPVERFVRTP